MEEAEPVLNYRAPKPKPRRKKVSPCRCLAYTTLVFVVAIGCAIAFMIFRAIWQVVEDARHPHRSHHYNATLEGFTQGGTDAVWPILDKDARFDVAVALWYSLPEDQQDMVDDTAATEEERALMRYWELPLRDIRPVPKQAPLFSDIVIRNASFQDKHIHRQITYQLPLERFRAKKLGSFDVRATFVLLPLSSVRFDRISIFSDWKPKEITVAPVLPAVPQMTQYPSDSIENELFQRWGVSMPLISFHEIPSQCSPSDNDKDVTRQRADVNASDLQEQQDLSGENSTTISAADSPHMRHPHILSRSHMIVVPETRPYDRAAFLKKHSDLQRSACKGPASNLGRHYRFCSKSYLQHGEFGLKVDLDGESGDEGEVGYLPYLDFLSNAAGPKDTIPIPVNRETCEILNNDTVALRFPENRTHVEVTWNLQFSSISAGRANWMGNFLPPSRVESHINTTERELLIAHDIWELNAGLVGHRSQGAHPWARALTSAICGPIILIIQLLDILYWYSRTSMVGLDTWATGFLAINILQESICPVIFDKTLYYQTSGWPTRLLLIIIAVWFTIPALLIIRFILPFDVTWYSWTKIKIQRCRLNHQERTSKRTMDQISPSAHLLTVAALAIARYLISYFGLSRDIIAPLVPHPHKRRQSGVTEIVIFNLNFGFKVSAAIFQIIMNRKCSSFAGRFRVSAILSSFATLLWLARLSQTVVGKRNPTYSFNTIDCLTTVVELYITYQAFTLPAVKQDPVEEEEE